MRTSLIVVAIVCAIAARPQAQSHPDFSGKWELVDPAGHGLLGTSFAATQDAAKLSLEITHGASTTTGPTEHMLINFNGFRGETTATYVPPASIVTADPTRILWSYRNASLRRAAWRGDQLVIVTHYKNRVNAPGHPPSEFESEQTVRLTLALDGNDRLAVESIVITDPDFETPMRMESRSSTRRCRKGVSRLPDHNLVCTIASIL